jgi:hypothetical protein
MKKIRQIGLFCASFIGAIVMPSMAFACGDDEIEIWDNTISDLKCEPVKFSATVQLQDFDYWAFSISATGTFYVDCGDGNLEGGDGDHTIVRTTPGEEGYKCVWGDGGSHTVRFGGLATGYSTNTDVAAISFTSQEEEIVDEWGEPYYLTQTELLEIDGSLGAIFPVINGNIPRFIGTFDTFCSIETVPINLFSGIDTSNATETINMFKFTFSGCNDVTSIPASLFATIDTSAATNTSSMFYGTFNRWFSLVDVPTGLFGAIDTSAVTNTSNMFSYTFSGCSALDSIPSGLFSAIDTSAATNTSNMFGYTFSGCSALDSIPTGLFSAIDTSVATNTSNMFNATFNGSRNLSSVPTGLFSTIDTSAATNTSSMFDYTFAGCNGLISIPANLFAAIDTSHATNTSKMFSATFSGCSNLSGIPNNLFSAIDTSAATDTSGMFNYTFKGCNNISNIPWSLFNKINTASATNTSNMFNHTFAETNISTIPRDLFEKIKLSSATSTSSMFNGTFSGCGNLNNIPAELFDKISTTNVLYTNSMFDSTFSGCSNLTEIPSTLFGTIDTSSATNTSLMFHNTFGSCSSLGSMPARLFSIIDTSSATNVSSMFSGVFQNCNSMSGSIPPTTFPGAIRNSSGYNNSMWSDAFKNTQLVTQCPSGEGQYITGFESAWNGKVSCEICGTLPEHASREAGTCTWMCDNGYSEKSLDLALTIGNDTGQDLNTVSSTDFYVDFGSQGRITGRGGCSSVNGSNNNGTYSNPTVVEEIETNPYEQYCYCQLDEYTPAGGTARSIHTPWVYIDYYGEQCEAICIDQCADGIYRAGNFRTFIFSLISNDMAFCDANTININWSDASNEDIAATNAGTAKFGGDVRTPRAATYKLGKIFRGWRFNKMSGGTGSSGYDDGGD